VLVNPKTMHPNPAVPDGVCTKFESLAESDATTKRSTAAAALDRAGTRAGLRRTDAGCGQEGAPEMHKVLDAAQARWRDDIAVSAQQ